MQIDRREFVKLTVGAVAGCALCGCVSEQHVEGKAMPAEAAAPVDAGEQTKYEKDGIYDAFVDRGFFIVRRGAELVAVASICTHRNCKLKTEKDQTFLCPCHGSKFDEDGRVTRGPARKDLPHFATRVDDRGHVLVTMS
jgi:cytochrome b6-f complex iron-sulfur subunit